MSRDCTATIPKARKRRSLDGDLQASPSLGKATSALKNASEPGVLPARSHQYGGAVQRQPDLSHTDTKTYPKLLAQRLGIEDSVKDLLHALDFNYIRTRLIAFRQLTIHFPFYCLRPDASVVDMATDGPLTTVAICTVTSSAHPDTQARLAQAFRHALSATVIIRGERSMDLLQGLMIFLAWHHNYMAKQQIHQLLYLLAGMAADLGLYRQPYETDALNIAAALEQDRAFLGCYYLCCGLSVMGLDKPSPLRWTDNLRRCADHLAISGSHPQDNTLVGIVELVRAIDDLQDTLPSASETKRPSHPAYIDLQTKATTHRLSALQREHPDLAGTPAYTAATLHLHHRLLRATTSTPGTPTLIQTACAIKEYTDDLLARPPIFLHHLAILDWTNLLETLLLLSRISQAPLPKTTAGGWETGALSAMLQPKSILDALCAHMAAAPVGEPLAPRHEGLLVWFRGVCEGIKKRILRERAGGAVTMGRQEAAYGGVRGLGINGQAAQQGRFRPVNEAFGSEAVGSKVAEEQGLKFDDAFSLFDGGLLDERFWNDFLAP
ncbi:hypothetical protein LTR91_019247 [Friedmanniomyces endolithicus]|uniref:Transcription factor domain-containing protein n=1 Tax=Friedmanniomyces endolithicus TaxID=329885 RepID=A0AAN6HFC2_9PEZI|nr:hypothetical protein LTR94_012429 [Friedmanniomyces endolithicus]KAK0784452.1 hypothetical protein LTR59_011410 [Friedmanniomyces endolithicus]KAK0787948.1 hypothetical protein LTR38_011494 [Friedmanniomyces endolithicus]KAK0839113.1 hypothetical protein LTR03_011508 [Friedmanniomyces endolithicus]KAK0901216.1 hypothetical protein LTR57_020253 [Friedmanniomyces endolithicus]